MADLIFKEVKIKDISIWDNFLNETENANIFSHSYFEKINIKDYKIIRYFIYDGKEIVASFKLNLKNKSIYNGNLLYSPINYKNFKNQNKSKILQKKGAILKKFIEIITKSFNKGNFYLDYNTSDIREFDWYNFDKKKKIFSFDEIKYTTILDTSKLNHDYSNISKTIFFKDCSERTRRQIKKSLDQNYEFKEDLNFNDYEKIIKKTFKRQKKKADFNIKQNFKVFEKLHEKKLIRMYKTFKNNEIQALMVVAIINDNSIFINGGRISDRSDDLSFTFNLINSFYKVKDLGVKKFDLEGINSPKRGSYKTGFGGDIYPYYNIKFKK